MFYKDVTGILDPLSLILDRADCGDLIITPIYCDTYMVKFVDCRIHIGIYLHFTVFY